MYYLKYFGKTVAEIEVVDGVPISMEILNPKYFFYKTCKNLLGREEIKEWIISRLRPVTCDELGIDQDGYSLYWDLFKATKGLNIKDRLYLADDELGETPWDDILFMEIYSLPDSGSINKDINICGLKEKVVTRFDGRICIFKKNSNENSYDGLSEELIYCIADRLAVGCCYSIAMNKFGSVSFINENIDLVHANEFLNMDETNIELIYNKVKMFNISKVELSKVLRMFLFDLLTRQLNRDLTNFGFYRMNDLVHLYDLYSNGSSLFSSDNFSEDLSYNTSYGESLSNIDYICSELKKLGVNQPFSGVIDRDFLVKLFNPCNELMYKTNGNNYLDVVNWIMRMYECIESRFYYKMYEV